METTNKCNKSIIDYYFDAIMRQKHYSEYYRT